MPVTFSPAVHAANIYPQFNDLVFNSFPLVQTPTWRFSDRCVNDPPHKTSLNEATVHPTAHGFIDTVITAYYKHQHLFVRPDDVWMTILAQTTIYFNTHDDQFTSRIVPRQDRKEMRLSHRGYQFEVSLEDSTEELIQENIPDPALRDWIIPDFTTTQELDRVVSSVIMMSDIQQPFTFKFFLLCGTPTVTLLGEKSDWEKMLQKIEKLSEFGQEITEWSQLLKPVLKHFVQAFERPDSDENMEFWKQESVVHLVHGEGGKHWLSGWITAFCFWNANGTKISRHIDASPGVQPFALDGIAYTWIDADDVPAADGEMSIILDDNGDAFRTVISAGLMGAEVTGRKELPCTIKPLVAWEIMAREYNVFRTSGPIGGGGSGPRGLGSRMAGVDYGKIREL